MKDDRSFNMKFIKTCEKYPCIYNIEHVDYNNKDVCSSVWKKIAGEMGETDVEECKNRWKNLRACLIRYLRETERNIKTGRRIKKYYLFDSLQFLLPHTKRSYAILKNEIKFDENSDGNLFDYQQPAVDFEETDEPVSDDPLGEDMQGSYDFPEHSNKKLKVEATELSDYVPEDNLINIKQKDLDDNQEKNSNKKRNKSKNKNDCNLSDNYWQLDVEPTSPSGVLAANQTANPDMDFFKSILDDIAAFSPKVKRKFKMRVLELIDELSE